MEEDLERHDDPILAAAQWNKSTSYDIAASLYLLEYQNFYYYYGPVFFQAARTSLDSYGKS